LVAQNKRINGLHPTWELSSQVGGSKYTMKKESIYITIIAGLLVILGFLVFVDTQELKTSVKEKEQVIQEDGIVAYDADQEVYEWDIEVVATNLQVPWDLAFLPDARLLITERSGTLKVLDKGVVSIVAFLPQVASVGESGLTGLAVHPQFEQNNYIYLYYTYRQAGQILNRVSRFELQEHGLVNETYILNNLPGGSIHNGGRMKFGKDNMLWVLTGDAARPAFAQDSNSLAGKVLRMTDNGSVPEDNPVWGSLVYSLGHRNPQGLDWHPLTEELIVLSHGETAHDEINLVVPNGNYGWPIEKKCKEELPFIPPILCSWQHTWAPSGGAFWGTDPWRLRYSFFFAGLRGNLLKRIEIINGEVAEQEDIIQGEYGRLRAVTVGPDNSLYVSTSNRDGRGDPTLEDDRILKVTPRLAN
jgi:aldose sugar dehydrogenase